MKSRRCKLKISEQLHVSDLVVSESASYRTDSGHAMKKKKSEEEPLGKAKRLPQGMRITLSLQHPPTSHPSVMVVLHAI